MKTYKIIAILLFLIGITIIVAASIRYSYQAGYYDGMEKVLTDLKPDLEQLQMELDMLQRDIENTSDNTIYLS